MPDREEAGSDPVVDPDEPGSGRTGSARLDPRLLEVLACPSCHGPLSVRVADLHCASCALAYPVQHGVPVLLLDDARSTAPTATTPAAGKQGAKKPAAKKRAAEKRAAGKPAAEKPGGTKPAAKKSGAKPAAGAGA